MRSILVLFACLAPFGAQAADLEGFTTGPIFEAFGPVADIEAEPLPANLRLAHAFDVSAAPEDGKPVRGVESAARFVNMHARAGMAPENIAVAVVVHGKAVAQTMKDNAGSPTAKIIDALIARGDRVIVCGQSAVAYGYGADDLRSGVEMSISAMTAHARLQQDGYTVNPF